MARDDERRVMIAMTATGTRVHLADRSMPQATPTRTLCGQEIRGLSAALPDAVDCKLCLRAAPTFKRGS